MRKIDDAHRCSKMVYSTGMFRGHRCTRSIWKDGKCKQHHPDTVKDRNKKSEQRWKEDHNNRLRPSQMLAWISRNHPSIVRAAEKAVREEERRDA